MPPAAGPWDPKMAPATLRSEQPDGKVTVGNVRWGWQEAEHYADWKPDFEDTTIDPAHVKNVYACVSRFPPTWLAAHNFLVFEFDDGSPLKAASGKTDRGLVVSLDARLHEGQRFDKIDGLKKQFGTVVQLGTWRDVVQFACNSRHRAIEEYPLDLSQDQKQALLQNCLKDALADRSGEWYDTYANNCTTYVVHQLNSVLPKGQQMDEKVLGVPNPVSAVPTALGLLLDSHGLLAPDMRPILTVPPGWKPQTPAHAKLVRTAERVAAGIIGSLSGHPVAHGVRSALGDMANAQVVPSETYVPLSK